ncbi:MAG: RcpC/CpaB family pilus assembly protein [Bryobacteraceae bacterium]|nr:RcpC/CpaB family pilus assembly protein [Bryobacteraceae bacterium]
MSHPKRGLLLAVVITVSACSRDPDSFSSQKPDIRRAITAGYRGVPVKVACWQAQYIRPGYHVDLLAVVNMPAPGGKWVKQGKTIMTDLEVMDVRGAPHHGEPCSVVFKINPNEAQYFALLMEEGKVHLTVRSEGDSETHPMETAALEKLVPLR